MFVGVEAKELTGRQLSLSTRASSLLV